MKTGLSFCIGIALLAAAPTHAQPSPEQSFAFLDADKDGQISLSEYLVFQQPRFDQFDANHDGRTSSSEFNASLGEKIRKNAAQSFKAFNSDGNGALSQKEFLGCHALVLKQYIDSNRDWLSRSRRALIDQRKIG